MVHVYTLVIDAPKVLSLCDYLSGHIPVDNMLLDNEHSNSCIQKHIIRILYVL